MKYTNQFPYIGNHPVKQINKTLARKIFNSGMAVYFHPSNLNLNNAWQNPILLGLGKHRPVDFDTILNEFEYYNCDGQRGHYTNFFINL